MRTSARAIAIAFAAGACFAPLGAHAFDSGSTGADGAFSPTVNTTVPLPPSGIFNYRSVNIPAGVTVTFTRNTTNTPVVILASGDVTIGGTLNVSGTSAPGVGAAGDGQTGDDGTNGVGGPGGFDGGRGGLGAVFAYETSGAVTPRNRGGSGLGAGGGNPGAAFFHCSDLRTHATGGSGGGFSSAALGAATISECNALFFNPGGAAYGSSALLPLIGGSGGGGGGGGRSAAGGGGGGGGGALLIAASGTVSIAGSILANGGNGGGSNSGYLSGCNVANEGPVWGAPGGGGSGGAIRIVATTISGNGTVSATGGGAGSRAGNCILEASAGQVGRVRLEAETYTRTASSAPAHSFSSTPAPVFVAGTPTLRISSVAGQTAPASPTGNADITLPSATPNPITVVFETTGVPVGNTVQLTVSPAYGEKSSAITPALTGSTASATASVSVNLPVGPSVLSAQTTYTVVAAVGDLLKNFAGNERVEKVTLVATLGGPSRARLITVSGKEYDVPAEVLRIAALGS